MADEIKTCWMIKWDGVPTLFSSLEVAKESIKKSYPGDMIVMSQETEQSKVFDVIEDAKIQDRVTVVQYRINEEPIMFRKLMRNTNNF